MDRKSIAGGAMMHKGGWKSRKQSIQPHFTAEAGYMTVDEVARDLNKSPGTLQAVAKEDHLLALKRQADLLMFYMPALWWPEAQYGPLLKVMPLVENACSLVEEFFSPNRTYSLGAIDGDTQWNRSGDERMEIYNGAQDPKVVKVGNLVIVGVSAYTWGVPDANKNRNVGMYSMLKRCTY
ncbi:MAG: hypothetical protein CYPHOPRED_005992 [Cyphobasidiales sp. Tagirdzhanova-0007]|nr:MAG: hypothetical protein CYPHOPRED_005992 [Cyphobasidiales sp. Tagirdzhanova-0007]